MTPNIITDTWSEWMQQAWYCAREANCPLRSVGALLIKNGFLLGRGANGPSDCLGPCDHPNQCLQEGRCIRATHAELRAIMQAMQSGRHLAGSTLVTTCRPCRSCQVVLIEAGVKQVIYDQGEIDAPAQALYKAANVLTYQCAPSELKVRIHL